MPPPSPGYTLAGYDPNGADFSSAILDRALGQSDSRRYGDSRVDRSRKGDFAVSSKGDRLVALRNDHAKPLPQPRGSQQDAANDEQRTASPARQGIERQDIAPVPPNAATARLAEEQSRPAAEIRGYSSASGGDYRVASVSPQNSQTAYPVLAPARQDPARQDPARQDGKGPAASAGSELGARPETSLAAFDVDPALRASRLYFGIDPMGQNLALLEPWAPGEEPQFEDFHNGGRRDIAGVGDPLSRPATVTGETTFRLASLPAGRPGSRPGRADRGFAGRAGRPAADFLRSDRQG